jgi:4-hydroxybenzoate polyprenyltransferase
MNLTKKILAYIKITRPINVIITFLVVVVAILISEKEQTELTAIFLASLAAAFTAAAGNIINDIYDIETDRISHPERVLVLSSISKKAALNEYRLLNLIAIIISSRVSDILLLIVISSTIILFFYSFYLKKLPLIGNITVAFLTGLVFIYGGFAAGNSTAAIIPAVFAFLINIIREIVKDIQDIEGDSKLNCKTFPIRFGILASKRLVILISIVLILFTLYPFVTQLYRIEYFIVVMLIVNPVLVLSLKYLFDEKKVNNLNIVSRLLKLNMVVGLLAIYLGK